MFEPQLFTDETPSRLSIGQDKTSTLLMNCYLIKIQDIKFDENEEDFDLKKLDTLMIKGKRYILELAYSRVLNCHIIQLCRRKNYRVAKEVNFRKKIYQKVDLEKINSWLLNFNLQPERAQKILFKHLERINQTQSRHKKVEIKKVIPTLGFKVTQHIRYSEVKKCLKLDSRCLDERIYSIFPKFMHPKKPEELTCRAKVDIDEVLLDRQAIKKKLDSLQLVDLEEEKDQFNDLIRQQMAMRAKVLHNDSSDDDSDEESSGRNRRRRRRRNSSDSDASSSS